VIPVYATTTTDRDSLVIVLDRAKNGNLKSFFDRLLDQHNKDRKTKSKWNAYTNEIDGEDGKSDRGVIFSILPWGVLSAADRMLLVFQLLSALKKLHSESLLHGDLNPENVLIDEDGNVKLAGFGGTKVQKNIDAGGNQKGVFTWGWADKQARAGNYSKTSEVYSFACMAYYMLTATPLFTRDDESTYLNNTPTIDGFLLQGTLKYCLVDNPQQRPDFEFLELDIFSQCV